jgi:hypothetical protein
MNSGSPAPPASSPVNDHILEMTVHGGSKNRLHGSNRGHLKDDLSGNRVCCQAVWRSSEPKNGHRAMLVSLAGGLNVSAYPFEAAVPRNVRSFISERNAYCVDAAGHFNAHFATLGLGMSVVVGVLDRQDVVVASDGCAGDPCHSKYALKTARIGRHLCIGMTGDTDYMRALFAAIGMAIPDDVPDEEIFRYLEETIEDPAAEFPMVWESLGRAFADIRSQLCDSKYAVTAVIVGKHEGAVLHSPWDEGNGWEQEQWNLIDRTAAFNLGRAANDDDEQSTLVAILDSTRGTGDAEARLVKAVRYWSDCDRRRTVNHNVFARRLSNDFALCYSLEPGGGHCDRIKKRLVSAGAVQI